MPLLKIRTGCLFSCKRCNNLKNCSTWRRAQKAQTSRNYLNLFKHFTNLQENYMLVRSGPHSRSGDLEAVGAALFIALIETVIFS